MKEQRYEQIREAALSQLVRSKRGVTLVEVVVVIAILLTLMSVLGYGVMMTFKGAQADTAKVSMNQIIQKVDIYKVRKGKLPSNGDGLNAVYEGMDPPNDPWGQPFQYVTPGPNNTDFDIISLGADGKEGGSGNDADIHLSDLR